MTTCANCGAENKADSTVCRMCATPLQVAPPPSFQTIAAPAEITCPICNATNELGWMFCLQCGAKLPQSTPTPPLVREAREPQPFPLEPPPVETPRAPSRPTAAEIEFDIPPPPASPAAAAPPAPAPPPLAAAPSSPAPAAVAPVLPAAPRPPEPPPLPIEVSKPMPPVEDLPAAAITIASAPGVMCPQCHNPNEAEAMFCYSCGTALKQAPQAHTRVMSSIPAPRAARLHLIMEGGQTGEVFDLKDETIIGRTGGDISFSHDGFMSGRHASIAQRNGKFLLKDEGSRNGTFIRIDGEVELKTGDMILIGKQVFRFES